MGPRPWGPVEAVAQCISGQIAQRSPREALTINTIYIRGPDPEPAPTQAEAPAPAGPRPLLASSRQPRPKACAYRLCHHPRRGRRYPSLSITNNVINAEHQPLPAAWDDRYPTRIIQLAWASTNPKQAIRVPRLIATMARHAMSDIQTAHGALHTFPLTRSSTSAPTVHCPPIPATLETTQSDRPPSIGLAYIHHLRRYVDRPPLDPRQWPHPLPSTHHPLHWPSSAPLPSLDRCRMRSASTPATFP